MTDSPFFSIVIPAYNRGAYISKTVRSVLAQAYTDFEILIIDDGSTDNTNEEILTFNDLRIKYFKKENAERGAARNYGVRLAVGKYVTFLDSDDLLKENHLQEGHHYIQSHPGIDIFHLGYNTVDNEGKIINRWRKLPDPVNWKLMEGNFLSCLGIFAKREILLAVPFNEDRELSGSEDYELWVRLAARYMIRTHPVSTACLVNHEGRSVLQIDPVKFERRILLFKEYLKRDEKVLTKYGPLFNKMFAYKDLYAALHLAISNNKKLGLRSLIYACSKHPWIVSNFRFWVVVKKLILY